MRISDMNLTHRKRGRKAEGKRRVQLKMADDAWTMGVSMAKQDNRSFSNWVETIIRERAAEAVAEAAK